ncbi:hypothetical protein HID58_085160 [Brassica napus]|uniref:Protein kinase domain-containing protein n=1 Tax=Brassica napus TaxID=3708 RepID=A0ABQ7XLT6_BRANA|nr:hypothetical protein HID58_085160 [Brassica napus]
MKIVLIANLDLGVADDNLRTVYPRGVKSRYSLGIKIEGYVNSDEGDEEQCEDEYDDEHYDEVISRTVKVKRDRIRKRGTKEFTKRGCVYCKYGLGIRFRRCLCVAVDGYTWTGVSACLIGVPPWRFPSRSSWILFVASCSWSPQCSSLVLLLGLLALVSPSVLHPSQLSQALVKLSSFVSDCVDFVFCFKFRHGRHLVDGTGAAIKENAMKIAMSEIFLLRKINHPNIIRFIDMNEFRLLLLSPAVESSSDIFQRWLGEDLESRSNPMGLAGPTPISKHLAETGSLPKGRALVPGCRTNETLQVYDVVAVACPDRHVVGLSKTVIEKSSKVSTVHLCPMQTSVRPPWAQRIEKLLKPSGELITLMFPMDERSGGPPYKVSVSDYEKVLIPLGFEAMSIVDKERAITPRKV